MKTATSRPDLVCPAGSLRALQMAVDAGADAVYLGLKDATNARNFAGLNFDDAQVRDGVAYAHARGAKVLMALNTFADARDRMWYCTLPRSFFDDALSSGPFEFMIAIGFSFEYVLTNLLFVVEPGQWYTNTMWPTNGAWNLGADHYLFAHTNRSDWALFELGPDDPIMVQFELARQTFTQALVAERSGDSSGAPG